MHAVNREIQSTFGQLLRQERARLGLTQAELAEKLSTSQQNAGGWEKGKSLPSRMLFEKLLEVFGPRSPLAALEPRAPSTPLSPPRLTPVPPTAMPPETSTESVRPLLAAALPGHLRGNVDQPVGTRKYRADYLSPTLCVEVAYAEQSALSTAARKCTHQLVLYRTLLETAADSPRRQYLLAIVLPQGAAPCPSDGFSGTVFEATILGLEVTYARSIEEIAASIATLEEEFSS